MGGTGRGGDVGKVQVGSQPLGSQLPPRGKSRSDLEVDIGFGPVLLFFAPLIGAPQGESREGGTPSASSGLCCRGYSYGSESRREGAMQCPICQMTMRVSEFIDNMVMTAPVTWLKGWQCDGCGLQINPLAEWTRRFETFAIRSGLTRDMPSADGGLRRG